MICLKRFKIRVLKILVFFHLIPRIDLTDCDSLSYSSSDSSLYDH